MNWNLVAQVANFVLAFALIVRLLMLRLHSVYRVFCLFLIVEFLASSVVTFQIVRGIWIDYRVFFIVLRVVTWFFYLWTVYALMGAILAKLPGILRLTRRVLNTTFTLAIVIALLTARPEYQATGNCEGCTGIGRALAVVFVLERVISMASLLAIVAILVFIVFFPVRLPRNLALFTTGYIVYFGAKTGLLLARDVWPNDLNILSRIAASLMISCFVYWIVTISRAGEHSDVTVGHIWRKGDDTRALGQLEAMNLALLRAARR